MLIGCGGNSTSNPSASASPTSTPTPTDSPTSTPSNGPAQGIIDRGAIQFAPGSTTASASNFVNSGSIDRYTFDASAGQPANISITSSTGQVLLTLVGPDGTPIQRSQSGGSSWSGTLPLDGTYTLDVVNNSTGSPYTVNLNIQPVGGGGGAQINNQGAITFPPGGTSTSVNGSLAPQNIDRYTFQANVGQSASLTINSPNSQVLLTLVDPNGNPLVRYQSGATSWSGKLPANGTYQVDVVNQANPSSYTLGLSIRP
jgi:hypothetical protein